MNYGKIYYCDVANGIGCRTTLFVSGCRRHCPGCFNSDTWNFNYGKPYNEIIKQKILSSLDTKHIDGVTILGGEPMEPENQPYIADLVLSIKQLHPTKTIWLYSGYTFEELTGKISLQKRLTDPLTKKSIARTFWTDKILTHIDILVDGPFIIEQKDIRLNYRGSSNQRIIDVQKSLQNNTIVLSEYMDVDRIYS